MEQRPLTQMEKQQEADSANMLAAWRCCVLLLSLFAVIFAGIAMKNSRDDSSADISCPLLPPAEALPSHGVAVKSGEACEYRDNMTWPVCQNAVLPGHEGELRCIKHTCTTALANGAACGDENGVGHDDWCESGVCMTISGTSTCQQEHSLNAGDPCTSSKYCAHDLYCDGSTCTARLALDAACTMEDTKIALQTPSVYGAQCVKGSFCQRREGNGLMRCTDATWGEPGQPCAYSTGQAPPRCLQGRHYCTPRQVCAPLLAAGQECSVAVAINQSAIDADDQCTFGYGCEGDVTSAKCVQLFSVAEGEKASGVRFCKPGLILEGGYCATPRKQGHVCSNHTDCPAGLVCTCTGVAGGAGAPGHCMPPPFSFPTETGDQLKNGLPLECESNYAAISRLLLQWPKKYGGGVKGYEAEKEKMERNALCCMKMSVIKGSHAWTLLGGYLIDIAGAEISCNTDLTWLYIMLTVTIFITCFGCCATCCSLLKPKDVNDTEPNLPFGDQFSPMPQLDAAQELKLKTSLAGGSIGVAVGPKCSSPLPPERVIIGGDAVLDRVDPSTSQPQPQAQR